MFSTHHDSRLSPVICRLKAELRRPVHRWPVTLLMRLQQALLHPHPMESNPAWAQTGVTMLPRINFHRVRAQYQPAAILEQPLLVSSVSREVPNARRFQGQTCSVSCEDFKNIYIWYPDQDQSIEIRDQNSMRVFSHRECAIYHIFLKLKFLRVLSCKKNAGRPPRARIAQWRIDATNELIGRARCSSDSVCRGDGDGVGTAGASGG